jgi:hypothetical protein
MKNIKFNPLCLISVLGFVGVLGIFTNNFPIMKD